MQCSFSLCTGQGMGKELAQSCVNYTSFFLILIPLAFGDNTFISRRAGLPHEIHLRAPWSMHGALLFLYVLLSALESSISTDLIAWPTSAWLYLNFSLFPVGQPEWEYCTSDCLLAVWDFRPPMGEQMRLCIIITIEVNVTYVVEPCVAHTGCGDGTFTIAVDGE